MSELMNARGGWRDLRWQLLTTVSSLTLLSSLYSSQGARAEDAGRLTVWIELGGQLEQMSGGQEPFAPPFVANIPNTFFSPLSVQKPLQHSFGGEGSVSFEPEGSDWVFSASLRYGRSNGVQQRHQQTPNKHVHFSLPTLTTRYGFPSRFDQGTKYPSSHVKFENLMAKQSETHVVLDFQAGKDVGLGMFGNRGSSVLSAGVRIAQFSSKLNVSLRAEPDVHYPTKPLTSFSADRAFKYYHAHFHDYAATADTQRNFRGLGPSLAWKASAPFVGNPDRGEIAFDWGANAAVLFGRQKARGHHQSTAHTYNKQGWTTQPGAPAYGHYGYFRTISVVQHSKVADINRSRMVVVPNLGGFAGLSFRYSDAKLSVGYRADFFFGAMDGGIDTARKENQGFYGPFATISIGLGG